MLNEIAENHFINSLISGFKRSPLQINKVHESDAEIIKISEDSSTFLAVTTDSIVEEIKSGLYDNPYLIGWMSVIVNVSDLAAVGARPIGILLSQIIPSDYRAEDLKNLQAGIKDACRKCGTFILGGDTNTDENLIITGTAVGILDSEKFISRIGCRPGDILYSTNFLGRGNAFAISRFFNRGNKKFEFLPQSGINYCRLIKDYASACMDTSDGVLSTLDQLMRLNNLG
ncbi:MAG: thiamine-phosphate kinase, partial [Ignavibacteriaceae bacterium]